MEITNVTEANVPVSAPAVGAADLVVVPQSGSTVNTIKNDRKLVYGVMGGVAAGGVIAGSLLGYFVVPKVVDKMASKRAAKKAKKAKNVAPAEVEYEEDELGEIREKPVKKATAKK